MGWLSLLSTAFRVKIPKEEKERSFMRECVSSSSSSASAAILHRLQVPDYLVASIRRGFQIARWTLHPTERRGCGKVDYTLIIGQLHILFVLLNQEGRHSCHVVISLSNGRTNAIRVIVSA